MPNHLHKTPVSRGANSAARYGLSCKEGDNTCLAMFYKSRQLTKLLH